MYEEEEVRMDSNGLLGEGRAKPGPSSLPRARVTGAERVLGMGKLNIPITITTTTPTAPHSSSSSINPPHPRSITQILYVSGTINPTLSVEGTPSPSAPRGMATRTRRSAATDVVEEEEEQDSIRKLQFNQSLAGKPGKPIGVGELHARLKTLCEELRGLEQEEAHRESLEPVAKELAHQSLLQHKDAGVRAWAACCIVDMFRLCAPDAPYTAAQLKEIFTVIIVKLFPLLADPSHPYNAQHLYVLKCLAEVKSIVLLTDIPSSGQLTSALFTTCFDVLSGPSKAPNGEELSKNVEHHMTAVLSILIDEAPTLSSEVVDVIVAQFLWADPITLGSGTSKGKKNVTVDAKQSTLRRKEAPPAYNMAKNICNACPDKMARFIGTYFSSVIVDFTTGGTSSAKQRDADDSDDERAKGPSDEELNDAVKAHRLLRELWRCASGVLQDIIPHLQEELGTENIQLRQLATETLGDMISGIGAAGPPPRRDLNPAAYPSQSLAPPDSSRSYNFLTTPTSPTSFPSQYAGAYHSFLQRKHDKSPIIRAAWTTGVGRILMTSAGGVGLDPEEEQRLLRQFADCLIDSDERVRLAAVRAIDHFEFNDVVSKLGSNGSMSESGSILSNLADRVKDKRSVIHSESIKLLGKIWGVAAAAIAEGNERITNLLGPIPSRILEARYVNDPDINIQIELVIFDALLPLNYPPMKPKAAVNGNSQASKESQTNGDQTFTEIELDKLRVERQLVFVRGLEERAKKVFFVMQSNQVTGTTVMDQFLKMCEEFNGGVMDKGSKDIKTKLGGLINFYGRTLPDSGRAVDDLWKFAKAHDRRSYQLIRFCMAPESEYRKVLKSIKELRKRIEDSSAGSAILETLIPIVYRVSLLCYNKSHVPAIIEYSRTDQDGLGATAHEVLKEISTKHPQVFSTHVKDLCKALESEAPTADRPNAPGAVENLKACASFAKKFPKEVPLNTKDGRKLIQSFLNFAQYGSPPKAAKHAVSIITSSDNKKEMHAKEILTKSLKNFDYECNHWLTKLAAISQLVLLAPQECEDDIDTIVTVAVNNVLLKSHPTSPDLDVEWLETPDDDMMARIWALRILVNRLRSFPPEADLKDIAPPIYKMLNRMVREGGEASTKHVTPTSHKNLQRLLAAKFLLKLSCTRRLDGCLTPKDFNELALVTHDAHEQIRKGFATKLMKYLGQNHLPSRFYAILFYCAYEPDSVLQETILTWIRSRRAVFASRKETILETIFARLLSLLAHHPDFDDPAAPEMLARYIIFYLKSVATEDNISLIYHVAQRVKGVADGINPSTKSDENLYFLSDLAQAIIRIWEEKHGWSMQSWPGKLKLPAGIFKALASHDRAQEIADKLWVDEDLVESVLEPLVRQEMRSKKRKAIDGGEKARKKVKSEKSVKRERIKSDRAIKTPRKKRRRSGSEDNDDERSGHVLPSSEPRRKSDRRSNAKSYVEISSNESEDDVEARSEEETDSSEPEQDIEMADAEEPEPEPEPTPRRTAAIARGSKKMNGISPLPKEVRKGSTPLQKSSTPARSGKGKAKVKEGDSSSPVANGNVRRSARSRG